MNPLDDGHLDDDVLNALLDQQVEPSSSARVHLAQCADCERRLTDLQHVVGLLRALPTHEPPRSFALGPRLVADPPNVVRLQRWYAATRVAAASLAAMFVFLVAGTLLVDATSVRAPAASSSAALPAAVPAPSPPAPAAAVQRAAQPAPAARPAQGAQSGDSSDQVAATTSVRPLPTLVPTPVAELQPSAGSTLDPAGAWRVAASVVGILAALIVFLAVALRHRVRTARAALTFPLE